MGLTRRRTLVGVLLTAVVAWLLLPSKLEAAAPIIMIVHGSPLESPVVIDTADDNQEFSLGVNDPVDVPPDDLEGRAWLEVAMFWGPQWAQFLEDGGDPAELSPGDANQWWRLLLGTETQPPVLVFSAGMSPSGKPRLVEPSALAVLAANGIPTDLTDPHGLARPALDALPATGNGGLVAEPAAAPNRWLWSGVAAGSVVLVGLVFRLVVAARRRGRPSHT